MYSKSSSVVALPNNNNNNKLPATPPQQAKLIENRAEQQSPDLSHLSEEERKIIEAVFERQRIEETATVVPSRTLPSR